MKEEGKQYLIKLQDYIANRARGDLETEALRAVDSLDMFNLPEFTVGKIIEVNPIATHRGRKIVITRLRMLGWREDSYDVKVFFRLIRKDGSEGVKEAWQNMSVSTQRVHTHHKEEDHG